MKTPILFLTVLATAALAQSPTTPQRVRTISPFTQNQSPELTEAFTENYFVTLSVTENEKVITELVIATARAKFSTNTVEPSFNLEGLLAPLDDGSVLVTYVFAAEVAVPVAIQSEGGAAKSTSIQYKSQSAQAQVRLKLGESLNVLRTGQRTHRLTVSKLAGDAAKAH